MNTSNDISNIIKERINVLSSPSKYTPYEKAIINLKGSRSLSREGLLRRVVGNSFRKQKDNKNKKKISNILIDENYKGRNRSIKYTDSPTIDLLIYNNNIYNIEEPNNNIYTNIYWRRKKIKFK